MVCRRRVVRIDVIKALHQSGPADRKVYVKPPRELRLYHELWPLLVPGYGLSNANSRWQAVSDDASVEIRFQNLSATSQVLSKLHRDEMLHLMTTEIGDDILAFNANDMLRSFVVEFGESLI